MYELPYIEYGNGQKTALIVIYVELSACLDSIRMLADITDFAGFSSFWICLNGLKRTHSRIIPEYVFIV
jgi:hypothetical protein